MLRQCAAQIGKRIVAGKPAVTDRLRRDATRNPLINTNLPLFRPRLVTARRRLNSQISDQVHYGDGATG